MAGIYIHVPFCKQACHYCNFYFSTSLKNKDAWLSALLREMELTKDYLQGVTVETIYLGGGTPSLLSADEIARMMEQLHRHHSIALQEFTIEANPDDLTEEKLRTFQSLQHIGLNRFSIGIQSFNDEDLRYMHRTHTATEAHECVKRAQDMGFEQLSIDLIYGTPTLTDENWLYNMQQAVALQVPHISAYALTVEPNTALERKIKKRALSPVDDAKAVLHFDMLIQTLPDLGFEQYEISNFAWNEKYALHNTNYWRGKKYLGLGPSAHSFDGRSRQWNVANMLSYIKSIHAGIVPFEKEVLTSAQQANEYVMTSLRTMWGCNLQHAALATFKSEIEKQLQEIPPDWYIKINETLTLTNAGKQFADRMASALFVD